MMAQGWAESAWEIIDVPHILLNNIKNSCWKILIDMFFK